MYGFNLKTEVTSVLLEGMHYYEKNALIQLLISSVKYNLKNKEFEFFLV